MKLTEHEARLRHLTGMVSTDTSIASLRAGAAALRVVAAERALREHEAAPGGCIGPEGCAEWERLRAALDSALAAPELAE